MPPSIWGGGGEAGDLRGRGGWELGLCVWLGCPKGAASTLCFCFVLLNLNTLKITAVRKQKPAKAFTLNYSHQMQGLVRVRPRY